MHVLFYLLFFIYILTYLFILFTYIYSVFLERGAAWNLTRKQDLHCFKEEIIFHDLRILLHFCLPACMTAVSVWLIIFLCIWTSFCGLNPEKCSYKKLISRQQADIRKWKWVIYWREIKQIPPGVVLIVKFKGHVSHEVQVHTYKSVYVRTCIAKLATINIRVSVKSKE